MKYREEVVSKIFTYITVIVLLGIIAFEAYILQTERTRIEELQQKETQLQKDLIMVREINYDIQTENIELEKFYSQWTPYAAFTESVDVDKYKTDLFSRADLIPEDAIEEWRAQRMAEIALEEEAESVESADGEDGEESVENEKENNMDKDSEKEGDAEEEENMEELPEPAFTFENPNGDNLFLPFGDLTNSESSCLIYTSAFWLEENVTMELLYELPLNEKRTAPLYDDNDEIIWNCVAYNIGNGWKGISLETEGEESEEN